MTTPTPESTERARKWYREQDLYPDAAGLCKVARRTMKDGETQEQAEQRIADEWDDEVINSLALEFDRIAIEAQERIVNNLKGAERHEWWEMAEKLKAKLAAHAAAHKAGEGE